MPWRRTLSAQEYTGAELAGAIRTVAGGKRSIAPEVAMDLAMRADDDGLTGRESAILRSAVVGHVNKEIASNFGIATDTVKSHFSQIFSKLWGSQPHRGRTHRIGPWPTPTLRIVGSCCRRRQQHVVQMIRQQVISWGMTLEPLRQKEARAATKARPRMGRCADMVEAFDAGAMIDALLERPPEKGLINRR